MKLSSITVLYIIENALSSVATDLNGTGSESVNKVLKKVRCTIGCIHSMRINDKALDATRYNRIVTYIKHLEELLKEVEVEGTYSICMVSAACTRLIDLRFNLNSIALDNKYDLVY